MSRQRIRTEEVLVYLGVADRSFLERLRAEGLFEGDERVPEEDAYARITADYGAFTHHTPWYAFPFAEERAKLAEVDGAGFRDTDRLHVSTPSSSRRTPTRTRPSRSTVS